MKYSEIKGDLFDADEKYNLVHCISSDYKMGAGIAKKFEQKFNLKADMDVLKLYGINIEVGDTIMLGRVFNLVTKRLYYEKPTYQSLKITLIKTRDKCVQFGIKYLAMPKIGCGLDCLSWEIVRIMIQDIFDETDMEIVVYHQ